MDNFDLRKYLAENILLKEAGWDYNEITDEFNDIKDLLIKRANSGQFVLSVQDANKNTKDTYGEHERFSNNKNELWVRIKHPMYMLIAMKNPTDEFRRSFLLFFSDELRRKFPEMDVRSDYSNIHIRPKKFVEQGFYKEQPYKR